MRRSILALPKRSIEDPAAVPFAPEPITVRRPASFARSTTSRATSIPHKVAEPRISTPWNSREPAMLAESPYRSPNSRIAGDDQISANRRPRHVKLLVYLNLGESEGRAKAAARQIERAEQPDPAQRQAARPYRLLGNDVPEDTEAALQSRQHRTDATDPDPLAHRCRVGQPGLPGAAGRTARRSGWYGRTAPTIPDERPPGLPKRPDHRTHRRRTGSSRRPAQNPSSPLPDHPRRRLARRPRRTEGRRMRSEEPEASSQLAAPQWPPTSYASRQIGLMSPAAPVAATATATILVTIAVVSFASGCARLLGLAARAGRKGVVQPEEETIVLFFRRALTSRSLISLAGSGIGLVRFFGLTHRRNGIVQLRGHDSCGAGCTSS